MFASFLHGGSYLIFLRCQDRKNRHSNTLFEQYGTSSTNLEQNRTRTKSREKQIIEPEESTWAYSEEKAAALFL
jgi:hypothetical protein